MSKKQSPYTVKQFLNQKKNALTKADKSSKGSWDAATIPLCDLINSSDDYYTTSSCSGRVQVWAGESTQSKTDGHFMHRYGISHDYVPSDYLHNLPTPEEEPFLWLKFEPIILHVACSSLETAMKLVRGFRTVLPLSMIRSIQASSPEDCKKVLIAVEGEDRIDAPIRVQGQDLYTGPAADWLVKAANEKLRRNFERIDEVTEAVKKVLEGVDMPTGEDFTASD